MPELVDALKQEVEKAFGRKIKVTSDCEHLSDKILMITKLKISAQTLRRF